MKTELRIVIIEDVIADVVLIRRELRKGGLSFRIKRVEKKPDFLREMESDPPDLVVSDHGVPSFDGFSALALTREKWADMPFIFVSGSQNETLTARAYKSGATDYVLKSRLFNLVPAIRRALREAEERARRRQVESVRDRLLKELDNALSRIKKLNGLLPVCVTCRQTRIDEDYWKAVHEYAREYPDAAIGGGLCSECLQKLVGNLEGNHTVSIRNNGE